MNRPSKLAAGFGAVALALAAGLVYRAERTPQTTAPDVSEILSPAQAEDGGTEPVALPDTPVLKNSAADAGQLTVNFGYKVGAIAYGYRLALAFAPDADQGTIDLGAHNGATEQSARSTVTRRWSDSRKAYLVAVSHDFGQARPAVPSLCVRAVIGPSKGTLDLQHASLCVMQKDQDGQCHPTTLACGLIR